MHLYGGSSHCLTDKLGLVNKGVNNKLITLFFLLTTPINKSRQVHQPSWVHGGHIQPRYYSSEGDEKRIYTFGIHVMI